MSERLVVVSNRVPIPTTEGISPGGLVSALLPSLEATGTAVWFGWSGETSAACPADREPQRMSARGVEYVLVDLTVDEVRGYYEEYGNRVLWPLLHGLVEHVAHSAAEAYPVYRAVNAVFARRLVAMLQPDDLVWIHDYHLIPLAEELRKLGWQGRTGYFQHTPVPTPDVWMALPHHGPLSAAYAAYDLIGVQTERDRANLQDILLDPLLADRIHAYPISIDPERFRRFTRDAEASAPHPAFDLPAPALLYFGVERLDYTKGIPQRLEAFERALATTPPMRSGARFIQWAAPSRTGVPEYQEERDAIEAAARRLNDRFLEHPLAIDFESHPPEQVASALQQADVCVVSSIADGMNLVAKEFAAVHSAERPGVLVLSDGCGAAEELRDALVFRAGDVGGMSEAMRRAYFMPDAERRFRAESLRAVVDGHTSRDWLREFVEDLRSASSRTRAPAARIGHHPDTNRRRDVARLGRGDGELATRGALSVSPMPEVPPRS
ncbi:MAG: trehalose-6-phosphate synthase [Dehalococcoidia bacterium]